MTLQKSSEEILNRLFRLINQLNEDQYSFPLEILSQSSIGKHVRHIIEFYECLLKGANAGIVDYDARIRNARLETDRDFGREIILMLIKKIEELAEDMPLHLRMDLTADNEGAVMIQTTFYRELAYNMEHAIHHMAIIRIGVASAFPFLTVEKNFGVANSTIRFQKPAETRIQNDTRLILSQ